MLAYPNDWENIEGFNKSEFSPAKDKTGGALSENSLEHFDKYWDMHPAVIRKMADLRREANLIKKTKMIVSENGGFGFSGHAKSSLHYGVPRDCLVNGGDVHDTLAEQDSVTLGRAADFHYETIGASGHGYCWTWYEAAIFTYKRIDEEFGLGFYPHSNTGFIHLDYRCDVSRVSPAVWWQDFEGKYHFYEFNDFPKAIAAAFREAISDQGKNSCVKN